MTRHTCTKCKKKRLEKFLRPVRASDRKGSKVWICQDNCLDGRMNQRLKSFLQNQKPSVDPEQSQRSLGQSNAQGKKSLLKQSLSDAHGEKYILDVCCGHRKFWFDKTNPYVVFADIKSELATDMVQDFRDIKFKDKSFKLVVFDPPHIFKKEGAYNWINETYGTLSKENWVTDLKQGFEECFRVLKDFGVLIFKWNEGSISVSTILSLCPVMPLFGHTSDKKNKTHWLCFMKLPEPAEVGK